MSAILATVMFIVTAYCVGVSAPAGEVLYNTAPTALLVLQAAVTQFVSAQAWEGFADFALARPAWHIPGALAVIFTLYALYPGRRKQRPALARLN